MFSLANTIDDFKEELEDCSNYYSYSFGIVLIFSILLNIILTLVIIYQIYNNKKNIEIEKEVIREIEIPSRYEEIISKNNVSCQTEDIIETIPNPIYEKSRSLPDWVIKDYLDNKKD